MPSLSLTYNTTSSPRRIHPPQRLSWYLQSQFHPLIYTRHQIISLYMLSLCLQSSISCLLRLLFQSQYSRSFSCSFLNVSLPLSFKSYVDILNNLNISGSVFPKPFVPPFPCQDFVLVLLLSLILYLASNPLSTFPGLRLSFLFFIVNVSSFSVPLTFSSDFCLGIVLLSRFWLDPSYLLVLIPPDFSSVLCRLS